LQFDLQLDVHYEPLSQLLVTLDKPLQLVAAHLGQRELAWSETSGPPARPRPQLVLDFPEPILGTAHHLRLRAIAPVNLGTVWRLPGIQVSGVTWQEGTATVLVPEPLVLERVTAQGCRESAVRPLPAPSVGEMIELQAVQPRATIDVILRPRDSDLTARLGTTIHFGATATTARIVADLATLGRPRFQLTFDPLPGWTIDAVETLPADRLDSWSPPRSGKSGEFRLREPVAPGQPLRLVLHAHTRPLRADDALTGKQLRVGTFRALRVTRALLSLGAEAPNRIRLAGDEEIERLDGSQLAEPDAGIVTPTPGSVVFVAETLPERLRIDVRPAPLDYAADIDLQVIVTGRTAEQRSRIQCTPEAAGIRRLVVHFSLPSLEPLQWTLTPGNETAFTARRLTAAEQGLVGIRGGETWEVVLTEAHTAPFELLAVRAAARGDEYPIAFVSIPGATSQAAAVTVLTPDAAPIDLESQNLPPAPVEPAGESGGTATRAIFRYEPAQAVHLTVRRKTPDPYFAPAWVWAGTLTSRFDPAGRAEHVAVYLVENTGLPSLTLALSEAAQVQEVSVDGHRIHAVAGEGTSRDLQVPLPGSTRYPAVAVRFTTHGRPLTTWSAVSAPWPRPDVPTLGCTWIVWLPPGFSAPRPDATGLGWAWGQRLFGPLLRPAQQPRFALFSADSWRSLLATHTPETQTLQAADELLRRLGDVYAARSLSPERKPFTWGELLAGGNRPVPAATASPLPPLWIDQAELARHAVTPAAPVRTAAVPRRSRGETARLAEDDLTDVAAGLLESAGLALIVHPQWLLLTSRDFVALHADQLRVAPPRRAAVVIQPERFEPLRGGDTQLRFALAETWSTLPLTPWRAPEERLTGDGGGRGWTAWQVPAARDSQTLLFPPAETRLAVHRPQPIHALGWSGFGAALGLVWWLARRRVLLGILLVALAGAVALVVAPSALPIGAGCFLGAGAGLLAAVVQPVRAAAASGQGSTVSRIPVPPTAAALGLLAALVCTGALWAAEAAPPSAGAAGDRSLTYRVLVPIDGAKKRVGAYCFLPREFYDILHREAAEATDTTRPRWLIYAADYRAAFTWNVAAEELAVPEVTAAYELEVFQTQTTVVLPIVREEVVLVPNPARLDGQPAAVAWNEAGTALSVTVEGPGKYLLELTFRPRVIRGEERAGFDVHIPSVARARLRLELPPEAKGVECPTALGGMAPKAQTGFQEVELGPAKRLNVQWPIAPAAEPSGPVLEASQLLWLKIRPGAVVLDAKFKFTAEKGRIRQVRLRADPRLSLLPPRADQPVAEYYEQGGPGRTLVFDLKPSAATEAILELSFWVRDTSGIGTLRVPWLEPVAERVVSRWLAVSVSACLEWQVSDRLDQELQQSEGFAAAWGPLESAPQMSLRLGATEPAWSLSTAPRQFPCTTDQQLAVAVGRDAVSVALDADIEGLTGDVHQYQLTAGRSLDVNAIEWRAADAEQPWPMRWSRDAQGVVLRFAQPPRGPCRLQLRGTLPPPRDPQWELPLITPTQGTLRSHRITIYRRPDVRVSLTKAAGYQDATADAAGQYRPGWGRLVAVLDGPNPDVAKASLQLAVTPNQPDVTARVVTTVARPQDVWLAEADCEFRIANGVCDAVRLAVPAEWKEPFDPVADAGVTLVPLPGQKVRHLVIRPTQAVAETYRVRIRGRLAAAAGERIRAPDVVPLDVRYAERYLVAPTRVHQQQIAWETSGLQAAALPDGYEPSPPASAVVYRAVDPRFQATIRDVKLEAGTPHVSLADVHLTCQAEGTVLGVAAFDLEPAGLTECELELPPGCRLVHASVADMPARMVPLDAGRWRVWLGPAHLAQQIRVLFAARLARSSRPQPSWLVEVPRLSTLAVERTLWTIQGAELDAGQAHSDGGLVTPCAQELLRLQQKAALIQAAADVLSQVAPRDVARWYEPWIRRLAGVRSRLLQWHAQGSAGAAGAMPELALIEARQQAVAAQLGTEELLAAGWDDPLLDTEFDAAEVSATSTAGSRQYCAFTGFVGTLPLLLPSAAADGTDRNWASVALLAALAVLALLVLPHPVCEPLVRRHPAALGLLLGGVWWCWFTPSWFGPLVILLSGLVWLRALARARLRRNVPRLS
jgi:hypothetical protein